MSSESKTNGTENIGESDLGSLRACLVEGDPAQINRERRLRRRSLLISVVLQLAVLTALVLVPLLSKTEPLPAGMRFIPMPPYHRPGTAAANNHPHLTPPKRGLSFCLTCPPVLPPRTANTSTSAQTIQEPTGVGDTGDPGPVCPGCIPLDSTHPQPAIPRAPTPSIVHVTNIDPALLTHRIEPVYPALAIQTRHEGTLELHAIIANDGSVRSLQVLEGDVFFYQSALDAVRQWRYKPTFLNGVAVEVDTHITVIYRLNR